MRFPAVILVASFATAVPAAVQTATPPHAARKTARPHDVRAVTGEKYQARRRFVLDVIHSAVSLPQPDPQDRLRVLVSAARLARSVSRPLARSLAAEGSQVEGQLIAGGQKPAVSMMESGLVDCTTAANFVDSLPVEAAARAEQSLAGAVSACPRQVLPSLQRRLDEAVRNATVPPRALLAAMQASGLKSAWSQRQFELLFSTLPDAQRSRADAPIFAAIYDRLAPAADVETARTAGVRFLEWLGKMDAVPERTQAAGSVTASMKKILGEERYAEALRSNIMAAQAAQLAGQRFQMAPPDEEPNVSVLRAMANQQDQADSLQQLGPAQRARQAAAYGFSAGKQGDRASADRYFDIAFAAADDAWEHRFPGQDATAMLEEVSSAAAHVDPVAALGRAQRLQESSAQAISMLTVAQVVLARQDASHAPPSASAAVSH